MDKEKNRLIVAKLFDQLEEYGFAYCDQHNIFYKKTSVECPVCILTNKIVDIAEDVERLLHIIMKPNN